MPVAWYVLGVAGAALHPARASPLTVFAVIRGAGLLILVTWAATRWLALPGEVASPVLLGAVAVAVVVRARTGTARTVLTPDRRDLPVLGLATVLLSVWVAPVTRHGVGAIGTGNHADLPSYLLQAVHLYGHGFAATGSLPGILPEARMFDAFGVVALLAPSTGVSAAPSLGVMSLMVLGAVVLAQLVDRLASHALGGARAAPALIAGTLLLSWAFTFNAFAYFLAQVWGLAFGLALIAVLLTRERGIPAVATAVVLSVAGALTYNPTGAMYAVTALVLGVWLAGWDAVQKRPLMSSPGLALAGGVALGGVLFISVWRPTVERLGELSDVAAGWPMPTAPLWAAAGVPITQLGTSGRQIVGWSCVIAAVAGAGWLSAAPGRRLLARSWPLLIPCAAWVQRAASEPGSYRQWKAFAYAQPVLLLGIACGVILLARRAAALAPASPAWLPRAVAPAIAASLALSAGVHAFWPRTYFAQSGCCIASGDQIAEIQSAADRSPGRVRVAGGNVWVNDVAAAVLSRTRSVSIEPPSIWPSRIVEPIAVTLTFETGAHPSLVEGRFVAAPTPAAVSR